MKNEKSGKKVLKSSGRVLSWWKRKNLRYSLLDELHVLTDDDGFVPIGFTIADLVSIAGSVTTQAADKKLKRDLRGIPKKRDTKKRKPGRPKGSKNKVKRRAK